MITKRLLIGFAVVGWSPPGESQSQEKQYEGTVAKWDSLKTDHRSVRSSGTKLQVFIGWMARIVKVLLQIDYGTRMRFFIPHAAACDPLPSLLPQEQLEQRPIFPRWQDGLEHLGVVAFRLLQAGQLVPQPMEYNHPLLVEPQQL